MWHRFSHWLKLNLRGAWILSQSFIPWTDYSYPGVLGPNREREPGLDRRETDQFYPTDNMLLQ